MKDERLLQLIGMWGEFSVEGKGSLSGGLLKAIEDTIVYLMELKLIKDKE